MPDNPVFGPLSPGDRAVMDYRGPNQIAERVNDIFSNWYGRKRIWQAPATAGATLLPATASSASAPVTLNGPFGTPDVPRSLKLIGSAAITGVTVNGLDEGGNPISEVVNAAVSPGTDTANAYASITSVVIPTTAGAPTLTINTGPFLGIGTRLLRPGTILLYLKAGAAQAIPTGAALFTDRNVLSKNMANLAPDGSSEFALYMIGETN